MTLGIALLLLLPACEVDEPAPAPEEEVAAAPTGAVRDADEEPAPPARQPELRAAPEVDPSGRPWLRPGSRVRIEGVQYETDELVMTFYEGDVVEHVTHDGVTLHRPAWMEDPPEVLLVRQSEWLWTTLRRVD